MKSNGGFPNFYALSTYDVDEESFKVGFSNEILDEDLSLEIMIKGYGGSSTTSSASSTGSSTTTSSAATPSSFSNTKSCLLDGSNDDLYLDSAINLHGEFTISFWFKHTSGNFPYLIAGYLFAYGAAYGNSLLVRNVGTITSAGAYSENTWFNVVLKRDDSNNVELFVDGTSKGTSTHSGSITIQQFGRNGSNVHCMGILMNARFGLVH